MVYERTEGNPLFMVTLVEEIVRHGAPHPQETPAAALPPFIQTNAAVPERLRCFIDQQVDRLRAEDQRLLEAASLIGLRFSTATVAAAIGADEEEVERRCSAFARHQQFLRAQGVQEWPDGAVSARYAFLHALHQNVIVDRMPVRQRVRLHRRIATQLEQGYGAQAGVIAAELAAHFAQGQEYARAVHSLHLAAETAFRRCAYAEAVHLLRQEATLLARLPATPERIPQELACYTQLGWALQFTQGLAATEAEAVYDRALALCRQTAEGPQLLSASQGLRAFYQMRGALATARELGERCVRHRMQVAHPTLVMVAHYGLAETLSSLGELATAHAQLAQALTQYAPHKHLPIRVPCLALDATTLWALGYPEQALKKNEEALRLVQQQTNPYTTVVVLLAAAALAQFNQCWQSAEAHAARAMRVAEEHGFADLLPQATVRHGRALTAQGHAEQGFAEMHQGCAAARARGAAVLHTSLRLLLAGAYASTGRRAEGLAIVAETLPLACESQLVLLEAWFSLCKGELLLQTDSGQGNKTQRTDPAGPVQHEAEACFQRALAIARQRQAKYLELRTVLYLSRLYYRQRKTQAARQLLATTYGWFTESFATAALQEAKALLECWAHPPNVDSLRWTPR